ncbi:hypothetical protein LA080_006463 [Diaporthe eres]|nr:hypothetical protein LA080_006463 [Diaporthe eres]
MASTSIGKKQWDSTWAGLPAEIRLLILEALTQDGCTLSRLATVSRAWQIELERHNFAQIRLTPKRLVDFGSMTHRNWALVRYIWFCFELDEYCCTGCAPIEGLNVAISIGSRIISAFQKLFFILSTWDPLGDLKLDISVYAPSDSQHWLKYLKFVPDPPKGILGGGDLKRTMLNNVFHDPRHGWFAGSQISTPPKVAIQKLFDPVIEGWPRFEVEDRWWDQLPSVPAVTSLLE